LGDEGEKALRPARGFDGLRRLPDRGDREAGAAHLREGEAKRAQGLRTFDLMGGGTRASAGAAGRNDEPEATGSGGARESHAPRLVGVEQEGATTDLGDPAEHDVRARG
jgi:hypothetical protein